ncbi:MAG: hypothetical protein LBO66_13015, partial [Deltaproteobacteria bacterium]|nr:hypothetical protein [Deltaproteobacteria bacterium]
MRSLSEYSPTDWRERGARSTALALASLALLLALAPRPSAAVAGQEVTLTGPVGHAIFGNGDPLYDYNASSSGDPSSLELPPDGNEVRTVGAVTVSGYIYGGAYEATVLNVSVGGNRVIAEDVGQTLTGNGHIFGGYAHADSGDATARGNWVIAAAGGAVNAPIMYTEIFGGFAESEHGAAQADGNQIAADGGAVTSAWEIYGGNALSEYGAAHADGNQIAAVNDGMVTAAQMIYVGVAYSSYGEAQANGNRLIADGGKINAYGVAGGRARGDVVTASNNRVEISAGAITGAIYGGSANSLSGDATASNNLVAISGGVIGGGVVGGAADSYSSGSSAASNNRVEISGGVKISGNIIGGAAGSYSSGSSAASNNRVDVSGTPDLTGASIYGGYKYYSAGDVFTGNVLNLKTSGLIAAAIANFEFLNFYLPVSARADDVILAINGQASFQDPNNSSRTSTVAMAIPGAATPLKASERIILIDSANPLDGSPANGAVAAAQGVALTHDFRLDASGNQLVATLAG